MRARPVTAIVMLTTAAALLLTGCAAPAEPSASRAPTAPTASESPEPSPSREPSATPTEEPSPEPAAVTCENILTTEANASLAESGLTLRTDRSAGYPLAEQFAAAGGTACMWARDQSDVHLVAAQVQVLPGEEEAWARVLAENGYTQTDDPVPGAFAGPVDAGTGLSPVAVVEPTRISFVSAPTLAADLAPTP